MNIGKDLLGRWLYRKGLILVNLHPYLTVIVWISIRQDCVSSIHLLGYHLLSVIVKHL